MIEARLKLLCDPASPRPESPDGAALWLGQGEIFGRTVRLHARGGAALTPADLSRLAAFLAEAGRHRTPLLGLFDSPGCQDGNGAALAAQSACLAAARPAAPVISIVCGEAVGFDAVLAAQADFTLQAAPFGHAYMAGPARVRAVTGAVLEAETLGAHAADLPCGDEVEALLAARALLDLACGQSLREPVQDEILHGLQTILPLDPLAAYAPAALLAAITDSGCIALGPVAGLFTGLGRIGGRAVGLLASDSTHQGGALDVAACRKGADFAARCTRLGLPVVVLIDCPGFLPGLAQEQAGLPRAAACLAQALAASPGIALTLRRGFGPAYAALTAGATGHRLCWPGATIGGATPVADPVQAQLVDRLIDPAQTRLDLTRALSILAGDEA
nr:carboxyl transferase domain-containing protein [uncultured Acidocella sp.]